MTEPMFKPSNRWHLPDYGKIINYGLSIIDFTPTTTEFASIHNLGPEKASSYLEHLRAGCICEKDDATKRYKPTQFFIQATESRLGEADLAGLLYFNYVHYMEPTRWLVLKLFDEIFYKGSLQVTKELIMERYIAERLKSTDVPKKHRKRVMEAVRSLTGTGDRSPSELSAFYFLDLYKDWGTYISLYSANPSIRVFALAFTWAWKRNFGTEIVSLETSQIIKSIEFPFRTFRLSNTDSMAILDELAYLKVIRLVKSADLEQVYVDHNYSEEKMYLL